MAEDEYPDEPTPGTSKPEEPVEPDHEDKPHEPVGT